MKVGIASLLTLTLSLSFAGIASAKEIDDIQEIGRHQQIFTVEKNINSQNIAVVFTMVDAKCRFLNDPANRDQPLLDFYWRMNRASYKPMDSFFKSQFNNRVEVVEGARDRASSFMIEAKDLNGVRHDLGAHPLVEVYSKKSNGSCDVEGYITLGPSNGNARIRITSIYGEAQAFPPAVTAVTLKGEVVDKNGNGTGKKIVRRYTAD